MGRVVCWLLSVALVPHVALARAPGPAAATRTAPSSAEPVTVELLCTSGRLTSAELKRRAPELRNLAVGLLRQEPPKQQCVDRALSVLGETTTRKGFGAIESYVSREIVRLDPDREMFRATAVGYAMRTLGRRAVLAVERGTAHRLAKTRDFRFLLTLTQPDALLAGFRARPGDIAHRVYNLSFYSATALFETTRGSK